MLVSFGLLVVFMPRPTTGSGDTVLSSWPPGCPSMHCSSDNSYVVWCGISLPNRGISVKLVRNIRHVSGNCWKACQG